MMYPSLEEALENGPETWLVVKKGPGNWQVVDRQGVVLEYAVRTKREAEERRESGFFARLWAKEVAWMRGKPIRGWKPYVQIVGGDR